jgi:hypothetical protein
MAPFDLSTLGSVSYALVFGAIGLGFGAVLEMAGFGDTRKLAAQFYLRDLTVLKTMFSAIVVAAVLVFGASALGLLDVSRVYVNPTYLWPGILGGLVMGVGFVIGGFCPGTSLVAAATLKVDGIVFVLGGLFGAWLFGESVSSLEPFWHSSYHGRFTLPDWLGISTSSAVLLVVLMALVVFWGAEKLERRFAPSAIAVQPPLRRFARFAGAGILLTAAVAVAVIGQPTAEQRWSRSPKLQQLVQQRAIFVDPAEVVMLRKDVNLETRILDLRGEHDFNLFHVGDAQRVDPGTLEAPEQLKDLRDRPPTSVVFLVSNDEGRALEAWKRLQVLGVPNLYVIDGGMNRWLERYPAPACVAERTDAGADEVRWRFAFATGDRLPSAWPELEASRSFRSPCDAAEAHRDSEHGAHRSRWPAVVYTKRVKLQTKAAVKGGCG